VADRIVLRPAQPRDFSFCWRLYFEEMGWIIEALNLDLARQDESFTIQWRWAEVRIIAFPSEDVGCLQVRSADDAIFLGQLYVERRFKRQGIGGRVMHVVIEEATSAKKAILDFAPRQKALALSMSALTIKAAVSARGSWRRSKTPRTPSLMGR
jgi:predicted N-acetyltransferase YhbS